MCNCFANQIYFHSMLQESTIMDEEAAASGGEFEIESMPTCMIEARSKDLVPIFDHIQTPKVPQTRSNDNLIQF